jgi:hypothetical protein
MTGRELLLLDTNVVIQPSPPCYPTGVMGTPKEKRPNGLEDAVQQLRDEPGRTVQVRVGELEVELRIVGTSSPTGIAASAGGWDGLLDCETFEREVHERRHRLRPATDL